MVSEKTFVIKLPEGEFRRQLAWGYIPKPTTSICLLEGRLHALVTEVIEGEEIVFDLRTGLSKQFLKEVIKGLHNHREWREV